MCAPAFKYSTTLSIKDADLVLLPWLNDDTSYFNAGGLPHGVKADLPPRKAGGTVTLFAGSTGEKRIMVRAIRLDNAHISPSEALKKAVADALSLCEKEEFKRVLVILDNDDSGLVHAAHDGAVTGGYGFDRYLSEKTEPCTVTAVVKKGIRGLQARVEADAIIFRYCNFARDLLNEPPNVINPVSLADICNEQGNKAGLEITVWDEKRLKQEKCGGILAVGQGSRNPPRLLIGEYGPNNASRHLVLVGKGITFDTGGYCLKPASSQIGMKYDMGGAAAVLGAGMAIAALKLPLRLTIITPFAENDISASAYHTTDIIRTRNGKSVQVDNTDAEGRLILSDALTLACEKKPDWIIDAATLTGACCVALGEDIAGLFGDNAELNKILMECGKGCGEHYWPMPLHMPYMEELKTVSADCKNIGGKWGGAITAALFLKQFVHDQIPWIHLDIAGPAVKEEPLGHLGKGAKGFGVKTLVKLAEKLGGGSISPPSS